MNLKNSFQVSVSVICLTAFFRLFRKFHLFPECTPKFDHAKQVTHRDFVSTVHGYSIYVRLSKTIQVEQQTSMIP